MYEEISELVDKLASISDRVIVVEVKSVATEDRLASVTEEVTWLRRTLIGLMASVMVVTISAVLATLM